jgi:hypothetical protein
MPRRLRARQADFDPGTSGSVEGPFTDENGEEVAVVVKVRGCEEERGPTRTTTAPGVWRVEMSPDTVHDLKGLVADDGAQVLLTIVTGACTGPDDDKDDGKGVEAPEWFGTGVDIEAERVDVVATVDIDDDDSDFA